MADQQWRRFGRELRHHRKQAGITQLALARALHVAGPTISGYETGRRTPNRLHAEEADRVLSAGGALVQLWDELSDIREVPEDWRDFVKVERQAVELREYAPLLIPGLLQTSDYARAVLGNGGLWEEDHVARLVTNRVARLEAIEHTRLTFVVEEAALRRVLGSEKVLHAQLDYLSELIEQRRIKLLVVPAYAPQHPAPNGSFRVVTLGDGRLIGQEESVSGISVITGPQVHTLLSTFGSLQSEALPSNKSAALISKVRKEIR